MVPSLETVVFSGKHNKSVRKAPRVEPENSQCFPARRCRVRHRRVCSRHPGSHRGAVCQWNRLIGDFNPDTFTFQASQKVRNPSKDEKNATCSMTRPSGACTLPKRKRNLSKRPSWKRTPNCCGGREREEERRKRRQERTGEPWSSNAVWIHSSRCVLDIVFNPNLTGKTPKNIKKKRIRLLFKF